MPRIKDQNAAAEVKSVATSAYEEVKLPWFKQPAWPGGPAQWKVGLAGVGVLAGGAILFTFLDRRGNRRG